MENMAPSYGDGKPHLVTGGAGYAGLKLGMALQKKGHKVVLFDIQPPPEDLPEGITFIQGDVRDVTGVQCALRGVHCVYHMASYGMSGREQLNKSMIEDINVQGTKNIIEACWQEGVQRLVYTSTYNTVFGGEPIHNGDETLPYFPLDLHPDEYSRTKSYAEQAVLSANGTSLHDGGGELRTCALRLAGVYGPGEQRHFPRIVGYIKKGLFMFTYGDADTRVEFLHVDNLVQAHILAAEALEAEEQHIAAGQAYFISDCKPVNNFEFMRPLVEGLGYTHPTRKLPVSLVYYMAFLIEMVHYMVSGIYNFQPLLTRTEVYKTGVTHYFSNKKARQQLGYAPTVQNDMLCVLRWFQHRGYIRQRQPSSYSFAKLLRDLMLVVLFASFILSLLPFTV